MRKEHNVFGVMSRISVVQSHSSLIKFNFSVEWHTHEIADCPFRISGRLEKREAQRDTDIRLTFHP